MAAGIMMRKEIPTPTRAMANFIGVEGARSANFVQRAAKIGAKMMMKTGLIDWIQLTGSVKIPMSMLVNFTANSLIVEPLWS